MMTILKNAKYKPMVYSQDRKHEILCHEKYRGYDFYIFNCGTHPTAYIEIPAGNKLYYKTDDKMYDMGFNLEVHGGVTYSSESLLDVNDNSWFIGWDYAHFGDYYAYDEELELKSNGKKWTTEMIIEDCINAIDQIIEYVSN